MMLYLTLNGILGAVILHDFYSGAVSWVTWVACAFVFSEIIRRFGDD